MTCPHRHDGKCDKGFYGGRPHIGVCKAHYPNCDSAVVADPVPCGGCGKGNAEKSNMLAEAIVDGQKLTGLFQ